MTIKPLRINGIDPFPPRIPIKIWGEILHPTYEITIHPYDRLNPLFFCPPGSGIGCDRGPTYPRSSVTHPRTSTIPT